MTGVRDTLLSNVSDICLYLSPLTGCDWRKVFPAIRNSSQGYESSYQYQAAACLRAHRSDFQSTCLASLTNSVIKMLEMIQSHSPENVIDTTVWRLPSKDHEPPLLQFCLSLRSQHIFLNFLLSNLSVKVNRTDNQTVEVRQSGYKM